MIHLGSFLKQNNKIIINNFKKVINLHHVYLMGIWSFPIAALCFDENGSNLPSDKVFLDCRILSLEQYEKLEKLIWNCGSIDFCLKEEKQSFEESIMSINPQSRIYGYWDWENASSWESYFELLSKQNPQIHEAQAHFICYDENKPFMICYTKNKVELMAGETKTDSYCLDIKSFAKRREGLEEYMEFISTQQEKMKELMLIAPISPPMFYIGEHSKTILSL